MNLLWGQDPTLQCSGRDFLLDYQFDFALGLSGRWSSGCLVGD